jgi:hypothetical protein
MPDQKKKRDPLWWANQGLPVPETVEDANTVIRQRQEAFRQRAMDTFSDAVAWLEIPGQLLKGAVEDVGYINRGLAPRGAFEQSIRNIPAQLVQPFRVAGIRLMDRPQNMSSGESVLAAWGNEEAPLWAKIAVDVGLDPLMFGTFILGGAKALKVTGKLAEASKLERVGRTLRVSAMNLEETGRAVDTALSIGGVTRGFAAATKWATGVDPIQAIGKKFFELMDTPSPFRIPETRRFTQPWLRSVEPTAAQESSRMLNYTWGELFFPGGVTPGSGSDKTRILQAKTAGEGAIHGVMHRVKLANERIDRFVMDALGSVRIGVLNPVESFQEGGSIAGGLGKMWEGFSEGFRGKRVIREDSQVYAQKLREIAGSWLDNLDTQSSDTVLGILENQKLTRKARNPDYFSIQAQQVLEGSKTREHYLEKARALAHSFVEKDLKGLSESQRVARIQQAEAAFTKAVLLSVEEGYKANLFIGARLSQWDEKFVPIVKRVAQRQGRSYGEVMADLIKEARNPARLQEFLANQIPKPRTLEALPQPPEPLRSPPALPPATTPRTDYLRRRSLFVDERYLEADINRIQRLGGDPNAPRLRGDREGLNIDPTSKAIEQIDQTAVPRPTLMDFRPMLPPAREGVEYWRPGFDVYRLPEELGGVPLSPRKVEEAKRELDAQRIRYAREQGAFVAPGFTDEGVIPPIGKPRKPPPTLTDEQIARIQRVRERQLQKANQQALRERELFYNRRQQALKEQQERERILEEMKRDYEERMANDYEYRKRNSLAAAFYDAAKELGYDDFATISPFEYIRGLEQGYLRRLYNYHTDPEMIRVKLNEGRIGLIKQDATIDDIASAARSVFGANAEKPLTEYILASPSPMMRADELEEVLERNVGIKATPEQIKDFMTRISPEAKMMDEILEKLNIKANEWRNLANRPAFGLQRQTFSQRVIDDPYIRALMQEQEDIKARLASLGRSGGRALNSQIVLQEVYNQLNEVGEVVSKEEFYKNGGRVNGIRYVLLPDDSETWGALAGRAIPQFHARIIASGMAYDGMNTGLGWFGKYLAGIRAGYLSAPGTAATNIMGNFALMQSAGVPVDEVILRMSRAFNAVKMYAETGYAKDFEGAEDYLRFLSDGTLSRELAQTISEAFEATMGGVTRKDFGDKFLDFMQRISKTAPFSTLHLFQFVEDWQRAAVYLWAKDRLIGQTKLKGATPLMDEIAREAAFFSNSAMYDYGNVGAALDFLRRSGLGVFPAYAYFSIGRVSQNLINHPGRIATIEHAISAFNEGLAERQQQVNINKMYLDAEGNGGRYIALPTNNPNEFYVVDLSKYLPQGALTPEGLRTLFLDPFLGGLFRPLLEVGFATINNGEAVFSKQYNRRVYYPHQTGLQKLGSTLNFLMESYQPVPLSIGERWFSNKNLVVDSEKARQLEQIANRYLGSDVSQVLASYVGLRNKKVDVEGGLTLRSALVNEGSELRRILNGLSEERRKLMLRGEPIDKNLEITIQQIQRQIMELQKRLP